MGNWRRRLISYNIATIHGEGYRFCGDLED
jgi:DNA-binding winged helix-turn-helix (wHTH) protein